MTRETTPLYTVSAAAALAGMHAQTLRQYDRMGLVVPARTRGGGRRYTSRDIARLMEVQRLSVEEGVNLAGIRHILRLTRQVDALTEENDRMRAAADLGSRVFHAGPAGDVVALPRGRRRVEATVDVLDARGRVVRREVPHGASLVPWRPTRG